MSVRRDFEAYFLKLYGRPVGPRAGNIYFDDVESAAWCAWEVSHTATSTDCKVKACEILCSRTNARSSMRWLPRGISTWA